MQIAIFVFPRITALDCVGPYEVLCRIPGAQVVFCGAETGEVRTENGMLGIRADAAIAQIDSPEILVVPGGLGTRRLMHDRTTLDWIRRTHETSRWTTSVCTGSLLLGAAGLLDGISAPTHWAAVDTLESTGARYTDARVVEHGRIMMGAGVSSGIDMALTLAARVSGDDVARAIQLAIEYDPQPPFDAGAPGRVGPATRTLAQRMNAQSTDPGA